jgi:FkbM family methyltransferase
VTKIYSFLKSRALNLLPDSMLQPLRVWHHRHTLSSFPDVDEPDLAVVRQLVEHGSVAVDLGANIGVFTKVLSELVGPAGTVIGVEPVPQTFDVLSRNVRSLGMSNVSCVNVAVSASPGSVVMDLPIYGTGGTNFYQARVVASSENRVADSKQQITVPTQTLDSLVAGKGVVGFVKCDVEGHELACLSGAQLVLNSHRPAWLVEVWGDPDEPGSRAMQTFGIFEGLSYVPWCFDGERLVKRRAGDRSTNYFFLRESHIAKLREKAPQFFREERGSTVKTQ